MTRAERLAATAARAKERTRSREETPALVQSQQRDEARKVTTKRRTRVGTLADEAGLSCSMT